MFKAKHNYYYADPEKEEPGDIYSNDVCIYTILYYMMQDRVAPTIHILILAFINCVMW